MSTPAQLTEQGLDFFRKDKYDEAAGRFDAAAQAYATAGQPLEAAEARNNLAVARQAQEDWAGALAAVQGTPETFAAAGDKLRQGQAIANLARAHDGLGHLDEAAENYEKAIDLLTELGEKETRAASWKALAGVQIKQDKKLQAMASMQAGLRLVPKLSPREKTLKALLDKAIGMLGM